MGPQMKEAHVPNTRVMGTATGIKFYRENLWPDEATKARLLANASKYR